mmetsp:Transcript_92210/g.260928  ORF Transcript_92210/g.260928 Transcript_92210/m.260928 type:complete len:264 (+) Transcript_92210:29-820(+)
MSRRDSFEDCTGNSLTTVQAGSTMPSLGFFQLDPHARSLIVASRVRRQLVRKKVNWIAALAPFDDASDGSLAIDQMQRALVSLRLGLSREEAVFLVESLAPGPTSRVSLLKFESQLTEAETSQEVQQIEGWAQQVLLRLGSSVGETLQAQDIEQLGVLSLEVFRAVMLELAPDISPKHVDLLGLLASKDGVGNIDYRDFVDSFDALRPRPPKKDAFAEFANAFGDPPPADEGLLGPPPAPGEAPAPPPPPPRGRVTAARPPPP